MAKQHDPDQPRLADRVRYYVDLFLSSGVWARFVGLFLISLAAVSGGATLVFLLSPGGEKAPDNFGEALWWAMMRVVDTGAMGEDEGALVRMVAVATTICGLMFVALLIGLVSSTVDEKIEDLRRGKSPVIDADHTLVLGFGEKVFPILRELRIANANRKDASIVILADQDKTEVEELIRERLGDMENTRIVVRQGSRFSPQDLRKVGAGRARSIVVPAADETDGDAEAAKHSDMDAIKTLLALRRVAGALTKNHAVVELMDVAKKPVLERLGGGGVEVVAMRDTLARLMVQTARQTGLAQVYRDLLTYDGSEFYFKGFPELAGQPFGAVPAVLRNAVAVGARRVHADGRVEIAINPPLDFTLSATDELLVLAEDDDTFGVEAQSPQPLASLALPPVAARGGKPERILVCGYRSDLAHVLQEFDQYVAPGSEALLMASDHAEELQAAAEQAKAFKKLRVRVAHGDPTDPACLQAFAQESLDAVLIVANDTLDPQEADARTVITLLLLRDIVSAKDGRKPRLISEILDPRTKDLVASDDSMDFVVSTEITSMLLAQVSERRELNAVFADLFDSDGNEIYLKSIPAYAVPGETVTWAQVHRVAQLRGEVAIGCFRPGHAPVLNPDPKVPLQFAPTDKLIVVAEDDREGEALPATQAKAA